MGSTDALCDTRRMCAWSHPHYGMHDHAGKLTQPMSGSPIFAEMPVVANGYLNSTPNSASVCLRKALVLYSWVWNKEQDAR